MKTKLILLLLLLGLSTASANLGDPWLVNKFRFLRTPVKMETIDETAGLNTRVIVYHAWGSYWFEVISADVVVFETIWCTDKSVEPPESVMKRFKSLYGEGLNWRYVDLSASYPGMYGYDREDHAFGFRISKFTNGDRPPRYRIDSWVNVGENSLQSINQAEEAVTKIMKELVDQNKYP